MCLCFFIAMASAQIVYVSPSGAGTGDGSSWANALNGNDNTSGGYTALADTLRKAAPGTQFWIAQGVYKPCTDNDRDKSFEIRENVYLYGGFAGNETQLSQRDWNAYPTILSGNIGVDSLNTDNSYHVVLTTGPSWSVFSTIDGFTIRDGYAESTALPTQDGRRRGGGIQNGHRLSINNTTIQYCHAGYSGSAINSGYMLELTDVKITNNTSGTVYAINCNHSYNQGFTKLLRVVIANNQSMGIWTNHSTELVNCLIVNTGYSSFVSIYAGYSQWSIINTTIANSAQVRVGSNDHLKLYNSIVWNTSLGLLSGATTDIRNSSVQGNFSGSNIFTADPLFVSPVNGMGFGVDALLGDWSLRWCSPYVNSGQDSLIPTGVTTDLFGKPRIMSNSVDIGAIEYDTAQVILNQIDLTQPVLYVKDTTTYLGGGDSWQTALAGNAESCKYPGQTQLFEAMKDASPGTQIWVQKGLYYSTLSANRNHSFELPEGVRVYGGFDGNETGIAQRNTEYKSILTGETGDTSSPSDNAFHVLKINENNSIWNDTMILDQLQVRDGYANGQNTASRGGGLYIGQFTKIILNRFSSSDNSVAGEGAGIYIGAGSIVEMQECKVYNNSGLNGGKGIGIYNEGNLHSVNLSIHENISGSQGIGLYNAGIFTGVHSSIDSNQCYISQGTYSFAGGVFNSGIFKINQGSISNNLAKTHGAGIYNDVTGIVELDSVEIHYNVTQYHTAEGGGVYNSGNLQIRNSNISNNTGWKRGGGVYNNPVSVTKITSSRISYNISYQNSQQGGGGGGIYNLGEVSLVSCKITNNSCGGHGGGIYRPTLISSCLIANNQKGSTGFEYGGGVYADSSCQGIFHSTIVHNQGQGIYAVDSFTMTNSIVWGNSINTQGPLIASHSTMEGNYPGYHILWDNPLFASPSAGTGPGFDGLAADWNLLPWSPCVNDANPADLIAADSLDAGLNPRWFGVAPDIGAFELQANPISQISFATGILHVGDSAIHSGFGTSWSDLLSGNAPSLRYPGYTLLYEAFRDMPAGSQVWLKKGTYNPAADSIRTRSFDLKQGVVVHGGFAGNETSLIQRDILQNTTNISGDIGMPGDSLDNTHILFKTQPTLLPSGDSIIITGVTFRDAQADNPISDSVRAQVFNYCYGASIFNNANMKTHIEEVIFTNNLAWFGSAIYNAGCINIYKSTVNKNCGFGAIYNKGIGAISIKESSIDSNFVFDYSYVQFKPAAILNYGEMFIDSSSFSYNTNNGKLFEQGGISNHGNLIINSSIFKHNIKPITNYGTILVTSSIIDSNESALSNSGVMVLRNLEITSNLKGALGNSGNCQVDKSIFSDNWNQGGGGAISNSGILKVDSSIFNSNSALSGKPIHTGMFDIIVITPGNIGGAILNTGQFSSSFNKYIGNMAAYGGAIRNKNTGLVFSKNDLFINNSSYRFGALISNTGHAHFDDVLVHNNSSNNLNGYGGVISTGLGSTTEFKNSTIVNNLGQLGLFVSGITNESYVNTSLFDTTLIPDTITCFNSIIRENGPFFYNPNNSLFSFHYCNVSDSLIQSSNNNINLSPLFVNPSNIIGYDTNDVMLYNWQLTGCSPGIDAGCDTLVTDTLDLAGNPRMVNRVDMGAYELQYLNSIKSASVSGIGRTEALVRWSNGIVPCHTIVFVKDTTGGFPNPSGSASYLDSSLYGAGSALDGWYCVYRGGGDSVQLTGLTTGTTYRVAIMNCIQDTLYDDPYLTSFTTEMFHADTIQLVYGNPPTKIPYHTMSGIFLTHAESSDTLIAIAYGDSVAIRGAGSCLISLRHEGNTLYLPDSTSTFLNIAPAPLMVAATDTVKVYGSPNPALSLQYAGFVYGEDVTVLDTLPSLSTTAVVFSDAGNYAITACCGAAGNYEMTYLPGLLTIHKAPLLIGVHDTLRQYGDPNPVFQWWVSGLLGNDILNDLDTLPVPYCQASNASDAGLYPVTLSGGSDNNYALSLVPGSLAVTKAPLVVTALDTVRTYGGTDPVFQFACAGFKNEETVAVIDTLPVIATMATSQSPVGNYPLVPCCAGDHNYSFAYNTGMLAIQPAQLTFAARDTSRYYGDPNPALGFDVTGLTAGDSLSDIDILPTISTLADSLSPAGVYSIQIAGGLDSNYVITHQNGLLTINPSTLVVQVIDTNRIYGYPNPAFHYIITGFKNIDNSSVIDTLPVAYSVANSFSMTGNYPIETCCGSDTNYVFQYHSGMLQVQSAPLTVAAMDTIRPAGTPNPLFRVVFSGFMNNEDTSALLSQPYCITTATISSPVGIYPILPMGGAATNYSFKYIDGILTVTENPGFRNFGRVAGVTIIPNPASHQTYFVSNQDPIKEYVIFDITGKEVSRNSALNELKVPIDLAGLPEGVYLVRVSMSGALVSLKLVVTKAE